MIGEDEGGDPACWIAHVCPECGSFIEGRVPEVCPRCGAHVHDGEESAAS